MNLGLVLHVGWAGLTGELDLARFCDLFESFPGTKVSCRIRVSHSSYIFCSKTLLITAQWCGYDDFADKINITNSRGKITRAKAVWEIARITQKFIEVRCQY